MFGLWLRELLGLRWVWLVLCEKDDHESHNTEALELGRFY